MITTLKKLRAGEREDVRGARSIVDARFNTNIYPHIGPLDEMNWGYHGQGPHNLALNILYTFTKDESFAWDYRTEFVEEFLEKAPKNGDLFIPEQKISAWIQKKRPVLRLIKSNQGGELEL